MKSFQTFLLFIALVSRSNICLSQSNEIKIRFIGNCGLYITDGNKNLYVDFPYKSGAHHYMEYDKSEITNIKNNAILIYTHKHSDHYSRNLAKKVSAQIYGPWNLKYLKQLNNYIADFSIQAFKTKHQFSFRHYSYLITWHSKEIYISGDTENAETIGKIKNIDWAFVPAWLLNDAKKGNIKIDAKKIGLYHIGQGDKITNSSPDKILLLSQTGQIITIPY
jgi:hypothetical protein